MTAYGEIKITFINFRKYYTYNIVLSKILNTQKMEELYKEKRRERKYWVTRELLGFN